MKHLLASFLAILLLGSAVYAEPASTPQPPQIRFTALPPSGQGPDSRGNIAGTIGGVDAPEQYRIVIYALTDRWYVQPLADHPLSPIGHDGSWSTWTHLGTRYGAILVDSTYQAASTLMALPQRGNGVLATAEAAAAN